jgi:CDP-ribitol ribitolphosphotransferase
MMYDIGSFVVVYNTLRPFARHRTDRVLFATDATKNLRGNLSRVHDRLNRDYGKRLTLHTASRASLTTRRSPWATIQLAWRCLTSAVIVIDDYFPELYRVQLPRTTQFIQLWHASGAFKKVGFARAGLPGGPGARSRVHRGYTAAIVSARALVDCYAEAFAMPAALVHPTGIPKTDDLFDLTWVRERRREVRLALGIAADAPVALIATTFRGGGLLSATSGSTSVDWAAVAESLPNHIILMRDHPITKNDPNARVNHPRVVDVTDWPEFEPLLCASDVLVTDHSSVIFDAAIVGTDVVHIVSDQEEYAESRGYFFPPESYLWGATASTVAEIADAISKPTKDARRFEAMYTTHLSACDGNSTDRVINELILPHITLRP